MYRQIELNPDRITSKEAMREYMQQTFLFEDDYAAVNLDALNDSLSEVTDQVDIILRPDTIRKICESEYAYKVLLVLGRAGEDNPNLRLLFRR